MDSDIALSFPRCHAFRLAPLLLSLGLLLGGCASLPNAGTLHVAERDFEIAVSGAGAPPVVFIAGLCSEMTTWGRVFEPTSKLSTAFAYNRAGYGRSSSVSATRDGEAVIADLRALLQAQGLRPPYILVGHSLGGLYAQYYARRFPDDIAGMVLIDTTYPEQIELVQQDSRLGYWFLKGMLFVSGAVHRREFDDSAIVGRQIRALPPYRGPVISLVADHMGALTPSSFVVARQHAIEELVRESGGETRHLPAGHFIQQEAPAAVVAAINDVLNKTRRKP